MAKYPDFIESTGYGDVRGLCGANCRHSFGPYIEGLSPETYSQDDLDELAKETVTYTDPKTGQKVTVPYYDATQILRGYERHVREWKRRQAIKEAAGQNAVAEKAKVKEWQTRAMKFTDETGIRRDYNRERIRTP